MTRLSPLTNSITLKKRGTFKSWHTANYEDYANLLCRIQLMQFAHFDLIRESVLYEYFERLNIPLIVTLVSITGRSRSGGWDGVMACLRDITKVTSHG